MIEDYCHGCEEKISKSYNTRIFLKENYNMKTVSERSDKCRTRIYVRNSSIVKEDNSKSFGLSGKDNLCIDVLKDNTLEKSKTIVDVTTENINKKSIQSLIKINKLFPVVKEKRKIIEINTFNVVMKIVEENIDISSDNSKQNSKFDKILNEKKITNLLL